MGMNLLRLNDKQQLLDIKQLAFYSQNLKLLSGKFIQFHLLDPKHQESSMLLLLIQETFEHL